MAQRVCKVYFAKPSVGQDAAPLAAHIRAKHGEHGQHLPVFDVDGGKFQVRNLQLVGTVWKGCFARLRDDAPNYLLENEEHEFDLQAGAHIIEKCYFLYREEPNALVWHFQRNTGTLQHAANYLSAVCGAPVFLPQVMNNAELEAMLEENVYEIDFAYARPHELPQEVDPWSQRAFDILGDVHAAYAKFTMRAKRGQRLGGTAKNVVRAMIGLPTYKKVKIRLSEGDDPIKLFLCPIRDQFTIDFLGKNAPADAVYEGLEDAYTRQRAFIEA